MVVQTYRLGELQTNCYLVFNEITKKGIVIDPADEANFISEKILTQNISLEAIVATHGHFDHIMAAWELQLAFTVPFLVSKEDVKIVKRMQSSARHWLKRNIIEKPPQNIEHLKKEVVFGKEKLEVILCPGHTPGGVTLYSKKNKIAFTGDTLFADGIGRTDFSYSSKTDLERSIDKLRKLPENTTIYPGHGESEILKEAIEQLEGFSLFI
jgi:hydroxyacylglutathione hydrolase